LAFTSFLEYSMSKYRKKQARPIQLRNKIIH